MILTLRQKILTGFAVLCLPALFAGCKTNKTKPTVVQQPPPNQAMAVQVKPDRPAPPAGSADNMASNILAWDAVFKQYKARPGETNAPFVFNLTNVSPQVIIIYTNETTCDCTVAQLPANPWLISPGGNGQIRATMDLRGKKGAATNYVVVLTSKGNRMLTVKAVLPEP